MSDRNIGDWLPRALVESILIVLSILLALGLDEWQEEQEIAELIERSINNFTNEVRRNKSRIEDVSAYHQGVEQLLNKRHLSGGMNNVDEFRNVMDAMQPVVLTNSAWQTAVATGVLGRMDFELVSALTLTYNTQLRFDEKYRNALRTLRSPNNLNNQNLKFTVVNATQFVADVTSSEAELSIYYDQILDMLRQHGDKLN
jgi:hypothetical protein